VGNRPFRVFYHQNPADRGALEVALKALKAREVVRSHDGRTEFNDLGAEGKLVDYPADRD